MKTKEKTYIGNVEITTSNIKEWNKKLIGFTRIGGNLSIYSNCELKSLTSVGGNLYIYSNCELKAESLTSIGGNLYISSNCELKAESLTSVGGYLYISSNCELKSLTSVDGYLSIYSNCEQLEKQLYVKNKKNTWCITEFSSNYIINENPKNAIYSLHDVELNREWFLKIKNDQLTPDEVFAIDNIEHRRIAYEFMDKIKMKSLKDFNVLDEVKDDGNGYPMRIVSFTVQNMQEPLKFYNCHCPSTGREYFIGTDENKCFTAKYSSFGLSEKEYEFLKEW